MKNYLKKSIRGILGLFGIKISFIRKNSIPEHLERKWVQDMNIRTVIDIGASKGNASLEFAELFPKAQIYAFEPLSDCFKKIKARFAHVPRLRAFNMALGDSQGVVQMHRSSYSGSSSLRTMATLHKELFPITAGETSITVPVETLDHTLESYNLEPHILVKIDVQGFEDKVISGGKNTLQKASVVIIETSFTELYEGQPLFHDIYDQLHALGFTYAGAWAPDFRSPRNGASIQQDSIFIKKIS